MGLHRAVRLKMDGSQMVFKPGKGGSLTRAKKSNRVPFMKELKKRAKVIGPVRKSAHKSVHKSAHKSAHRR